MDVCLSNKMTAVVYDECLDSHYNAWNKDFTETPQRTSGCINRCEELHLLNRCKRIPVREATTAEMLLCHTQKYLDLLQSTEHMDKQELMKVSQKFDFIYFHQKSFENAKLAVGGIIDLVEEVVTQKVLNGMAVTRPPGHHAMQEEACGYCYLSNAAIAARAMLERHKLKRILILDWDVHHGQGSQYAFYDDPRVMYVSIHRYELGTEWPCLREGDYDYIGQGAGKGFNINVPMNETECGDSDYLAVFFNLLLPVFYEFDPELVIVSAGYDAAVGCPEGEMSVTPACFAHFVNLLTPLASGKLVLVLEGGYNLKSLAESAALSLRALLGDPTPAIPPLAPPKDSVVESVLNCIKLLHPMWASLRYQDLVDGSSLDQQRYPYPRVLSMPPAQDVSFYTDETRPEVFPLIQSCASEDGLQRVGGFDQIIDQLIHNTNLSAPNFKLGFITDNEANLDQQFLAWMQKNKMCNVLQVDSHFNEALSAEGPHQAVYVKVAVNSLFSSLIGSGMCVVTSSDGPSKLTDQDLASVAAHHAEERHGVQRVLIVDIGCSSTGQSPMCHMKSASLLWISLDLLTPETNCTCSSKVHKTCSHSHSCVHLPFDQDSLSDNDIISSLHQVVLPLSYEGNESFMRCKPGTMFCPNFVIFSWKMSSQLLQSNGTPRLGCLGHMVQTLRGLANGRLLLMVENDLHELSSQKNKIGPPVESASQILKECASVVLGERCKPVLGGAPSSKTVSMIKDLQDELKNQWHSFKFRERIPHLQ